jgi:hypothetical protein
VKSFRAEGFADLDGHISETAAAGDLESPVVLEIPVFHR